MMNINNNDIPSMNNIYDSSFWNKVREDELKKSTDMYNLSKDPFKTGIVQKPAYSDMFLELNNEENNSLTGNKIDKENFKHNNMQPFYRGKITQNVDIEKTPSKLEYFNGNKEWRNKKEVEPFFKVTSGFGNVCSMKNNDDFYKGRIVDSKIKNNDFPIQQIKVGPGLNKGYTSEGYGGFQQHDANNYAMPKTLDELRSKSNQKNSCYQIPVQAPIKGTDQRGIVNPFSKNRPEKVYNQTEERWIKTTGATLKDTQRPDIYIKPTSKIDTHIEYNGVIKNAINDNTIDNDYGKKSIMVYDNERNITECRTVVNNLKSTVNAIVAPILDVLRLTNKEYTIDTARQFGNVNAQIPEKATLYDPITHCMKTTIKETTIHDTEFNNLTGPDASYSAIDDNMKTTVKETTIHDTSITNIKAPGGNYINNGDNAKTTNKEIIVGLTDNIRNIGLSTYKVYVYDPDLVVKTTTKETTIKPKSELGFIGGFLEKMFGAYQVIPVSVKNTQKQYVSDYENYGIAQSSISTFKQTSREAENNAEIDGTREMLLINSGHTPNGGGKYVGQDKNDINMKIKKPEYEQRNAGNIKLLNTLPPEPLDKCSITRTNEELNSNKNLLDPLLLSSLKDNELNISINPI